MNALPWDKAVLESFFSTLVRMMIREYEVGISGTGSEVSAATPAAGFAVVLRYRGHIFVTVSHPDTGRGIRPEEVWIFGAAKTTAEIEVWKVIQPLLVWVPDGMVHRFPR